MAGSTGRRRTGGRCASRPRPGGSGRPAACRQGLENGDRGRRFAAAMGHGLAARRPHPGHRQARHAASAERQAAHGDSDRRPAAAVHGRAGRPARHRAASGRQDQSASLHDPGQRHRRREPDRAGAGRLRRQAGARREDPVQRDAGRARCRRSGATATATSRAWRSIRPRAGSGPASTARAAATKSTWSKAARTTAGRCRAMAWTTRPASRSA